jgi:hypothetical protein
MTVWLPSNSCLVTRRLSCSQASSRPLQSLVNRGWLSAPGIRYTLTSNTSASIVKYR